MTTRYNGGASFPDDGDDANKSNDYGSGSYGSSDYSVHPEGYSTNYGGEGYAAGGADMYDVNTNHGALRYHGTQIADGTFGDGHEPHPLNDPGTNGWVHRRGTGKINVMDAWAFGFKETFANAKVWLVVGFVMSFVVGGLSAFIPFVGIATLFIYPLLYSMALMGTLARTFSYNQITTPRYGLILGVTVVMGVIGAVVAGIGFALSIPFMGDLLTNPALQNMDPDAGLTDDSAMAIFGAILRLAAVMAVVSFLASPFFYLPPYYAADNNGSFGECLKRGFGAAARNYPQLLLFSLISFLVSIVAMIPLFLGLIVVVPASMLAMAYAYRQVSGGPVPYSE